MASANRSISKINAIMILILALTGALIAGYVFVIAGSSSIQNTTLMLDFTPAGSHTPFYYGLDNGIYSNNGINLTILAGHGSASSINALAQGKVNFALADTGTLAYLAASSNITNVKIIAMIYPNTTFAVLYNKADISSPKDLENKTIAATQGGSVQVFDVFFQLNNVNTSLVKIEFESTSLYNQMVALGKVDASLGSVGQYALLQESAAQNNIQLGMFPLSEYGLPIYGVAIMTTQQMIDQHSNQVKEFVTATMQSLLASVRHPTDAVASLVKYNPQLTASGQLADFESFISNTLPPGINQTSNALTLGWIDSQKMNSTMSVIAQAYGISNPPPASTLYTEKFVQSS